MQVKEWKKNIRTVVPYIPGEQPKEENVIKLNTNENPYPPSKKVMDKLKEIENLRLYPDPSAKLLVDEIAKHFHVNSNQVFVGVGSDDVLAMAFLTFFNGKNPIFFPDITYSFYDVWAELFQIPYEKQALDSEFRIKKEDYYKENGGIIFPNPNAPTGIGESLVFIEDIVKHNQDSVVIIDEAYVDFGGESAISLVEQYENLLVVQTFSKSRSMAGMRIGYAIGSETLIQAMQNVKYSFNSYTMNQPSISLGVESLKDQTYFEEIVKKIINTREWFGEELKKLGFEFPNSKTNFLFVTHPIYSAKDMYEKARKERIYVRYFEKPRIDNYLRITIGTEEEMKALLAFFKKYMEIR